MREIQFRGERIDNGEWVYGNLIKMDSEGSQCFIFPFFEYASSRTCAHIVARGMIAVIPETVGQCTGLKDKKGKEIYEGDVVLAECNATMQTKRQIKTHKCKVVYSSDFHGWSFPIVDMPTEAPATSRATSYFRFGYKGDALEVIGNIHEGN